MKIRELEKLTGIPRSTIHYYVNHGLLHRPQKSGQTMAYYDNSHIKRLETIQKIKLEYLKSVKTSRIPIDHIKQKLRETYSIGQKKVEKETTPKGKWALKQEIKKEQIMEATLGLYSNRGYHLTNIRDVSAAVGISPPTFYRYFKDKRELFIETIEYVLKKLKTEIQESVKDEKDLSKRSIIMFDIFYKHYPKIGEILNQLRSRVIIGDPWAKERLSRLYNEMMENLVKNIKRSIQSKTIKPVDPYLLAYFNLAINEMAMNLAAMDDNYTIDDVMYFVGDMFNSAFLTPKGKQSFELFYKPRKVQQDPVLNP